MPPKFITLLGSIRETVTSTYGPGLLSYVKWVYYGLFRINRFIVVMAETKDFDPDVEPVPLVRWTVEQLAAYREGKKLPKQFYMDVVLGLDEPWVIVTDQGEVAYILWKVPKGKARFTLFDDDDCEVNYSLTMPDFRRQGLHKKCHAQFIREVKEQGYKRVYGIAHIDHFISLRAVTPFMPPFGMVTSIGRFPLKRKPSQMSKPDPALVNVGEDANAG